jgi:hypothetical protein
MRLIICHVAVVTVLGVISACAVDGDPTSRGGGSTEITERNQELQRPASAAALTSSPCDAALPPPWSGFDPQCVRIWVPDDAAGAPCPPDYVCMYQHVNRRGVAWGFADGEQETDFRQVPCPSCASHNFNDNASSWHNNSGEQYCWYYAIFFSEQNIFHHMGNGDAINMSTSDNDKASSLGPCS